MTRAAGPASRGAILAIAVAAGSVEWEPAAARAQATAAPPGAFTTYRIEPPPKNAAELRARFDADQIAILELLNRADAAHLTSIAELVVPERWVPDPMAYSPFPVRYAWGADQAQLLVVDKRAQAFAAYEQGQLVRWGPVSTGRRGLQTPAGLFHLNWRSRGRHSTVDPDWYMEWYFNFENRRGLSFHQYALPGRPASHACTRLLERDARWIYDWGESWVLDDRGWNVLDPGTPVLLLGCYDFTGSPPWRSPAWLARGVQLPDAPPLSQVECTDTAPDS